MQVAHEKPLIVVLESLVGSRNCAEILRAVEVPWAAFSPVGEGRIGRAELAMALALALFDDVRRRVPMAAAYVGDAVAAGRRLCFDHGALRTVASPAGELPLGRESIARILRPLGYREVEQYPLPALRMQGFAYRSIDLPETLPQYFVSELDPRSFSPDFQRTVHEVLASSRDPLPRWTRPMLGELEQRAELALSDALRLLPTMLSCFERQHEEPSVAQYELLRAESAEMAWIATEGHSMNHATDRVADVEAVAAEQRRLGRPIKDRVEVSSSGRVRQTAFRAASVQRLFRTEAGHFEPRVVPGSFHEFISRDRMEDGHLDLRFDSSNAQGIFKMTEGGRDG